MGPLTFAQRFASPPPFSGDSATLDVFEAHFVSLIAAGVV